MTAERHAKAETLPERATSPATNRPGPWNVVLLDDQEHTYEYVIRMLRELFGFSVDRAFQLAKKVDDDGRVVCLTTHKEHAELKREQILAYGKDPLIASCAGSMSAVIEPAVFEGEDRAGP